MTGRTMGGFVIQERIGRGGMATVYRAFQPSVNRSVALKVIQLQDEPDDADEFRRRFTQEANVIASLEHPHILPVFDYGIEGSDTAYLAMRLMRGGSLNTLIHNQPMAVDHALDLFAPIARGLEHAHQRGVIHRDLKPGNILLDESGNPYLSDFGLAKLIERTSQITRTGALIGTPTYMSPEQLRGEPLDTRSDIYSLGVVFYHMLAGRPPFEITGANIVTVIYQHLDKTPPPLSRWVPDIPYAIDAAVMQALSKDVNTRYPSALDMLNALYTAVNRAPVRARLGDTGSTREAARSGDSSTDGKSTDGRSTITPLIGLPTEYSTPGAVPGAGAGAGAGEPTSGRTVLLPESLPPLASTPGVRPAVALRRWQGWALAALAAGVMAALVIAAATLPALFAPPPPTWGPPSVEVGSVVPANTLVVTEAERESARAHLGDTGFIAYISCTRDNEYHVLQAREVLDMFASLNMPTRLYDGAGDVYRQITSIESARTDGARGFIVCPLDEAVLDDTLRALDQSDFPLIYLAEPSEAHGGVKTATDEMRMGEVAGRALAEAIRDELSGPPTVLTLGYSAMPQLIERASGLQAGFRAVIPDAVFLETYFQGGLREDGQRSVAQALSDGVAFDVILSINDAGALGAVAALEAADVSPDAVFIGGIDGEAAARSLIARNHFMRATVLIGRTNFSQAIVDGMIKLLAGTPVSETLTVEDFTPITAETLADAAAPETTAAAR
jgi:serine/threonine-protein kinase